MLDAERAKCSFDVNVLMDLLGTGKRMEQRENARRLFREHPSFKPDPVMEHYMSYEEQFKAQLEHAASAIEITRDNPLFMAQHMSGNIQSK